MMDVLFLSLLYDRERYAILEKAGVNVAANVFQWNLVHGIEKNLHYPINIINSIPCGVWPRQFGKLFFKEITWPREQNEIKKDIAFINFHLFKQSSRYYATKKNILYWLSQGQLKDKAILIYNLYLPYLKAIKAVKKKYPNVPIVSVITDLPNEYGIVSAKGIWAFFMREMGKRQLECAKYIDKYVLLTDYMKYPLCAESKPYIVVEGLVDVLVSDIAATKKNTEKGRKKILLYSGTVSQDFNVDMLIDAFIYVDNRDYELHIYGDGPYGDALREIASTHSNIKFFGMVSRDIVLEKQKEATILVNPRLNIGEYTKYSFPSKTMEYMSSGRPLIAFKLDGMPDEYMQYLYVVDENSAQGLAEKMREVFELTDEELDSKGKQAYQFIVDNKTIDKQSARIVKLLRNEETELVEAK